MNCVVFLSIAALFYVFFGYGFILRLLAGIMRSQAITVNENNQELPKITVLITAFNEVKVIEARITNILQCAYPAGLLEVIVASDGSTDGTDDVVRGIRDPRVKLFRPEIRTGKTDTQNQAIGLATGDVIVFTDADTRFDKGFINEIARPFLDPTVGGADGHLLFRTHDSNEIAVGQGRYWRTELKLREFESSLGILAVASGACMAIRKRLFVPMPASVGEDCLVPLDVVSQGYRMVHVSGALAYDSMPSSSQTEFRTRVRMTLRNWQGTWMYPHLLNPFSRFGIAWALWSHKLLRWLSPLFLFSWLTASPLVLVNGHDQLWVALPGITYILLQFTATLFPFLRKAKVIGFVNSFTLANIGFLVGVVKAISGARVLIYKQ